MAHVPRTHRLITLADHICVGFIMMGFIWEYYKILHVNLSSHLLPSVHEYIHCSQCLTKISFLFFFGHIQQIITQDFARNQAASQASLQPPTTTFQNSTPAPTPVSGRAKTSSRYSPEAQPQPVHHQRPGARVSPENLSDKARGR